MISIGISEFAYEHHCTANHSTEYGKLRYCTMVYRGTVPWYTAVPYHGIPRYRTMVYRGTVPWYTVVYRGTVPWYTVVYRGTVPWYTAVYLLRYPMVYRGIPWYIVPWYTMVLFHKGGNFPKFMIINKCLKLIQMWVPFYFTGGSEHALNLEVQEP